MHRAISMSAMAGPEEFLPESATADQWRRYHAFRRRLQQEWRPDDPFTPDDVVEAQLRQHDTNHLWHRWHVDAADETAGVLHAATTHPRSPEYESSRHLMWVDTGYVLEAHRRRGVARSLVPAVVERMEQLGVTTLTAPADGEGDSGFLLAAGAEPRFTERCSRLDVRQVDWAAVDGWVREGEQRSPGARLELHPGRIPDGLLAEYSSAMTEMLNTMPFEDMDHGEIITTPEHLLEHYGRHAELGSVDHTALVRDADGSIVGATDVTRHPYEPGLVHQGFTGVHPRARGRRIGWWLKAAMLRYVRELHPDTVAIDTENARSNQWMLAINHALGFRLRRVVTWYQVTRERLAAGAVRSSGAAPR